MKRLKGSVYHSKKDEEGRVSLQRDVQDFQQGQYGEGDSDSFQESANESQSVLTQTSRNEEFFFDHEL